jgi:transcriptional regulator with XRE-family HTH domain
LRSDSKHLLQVISRNVAQHRRAMDLSQQELADRSQLSRRMISLIEGGECNVSLATLGHIAAALDLTFLELVSEPERQARQVPERGLRLWEGGSPGTRVDLLQSFPASRTVELWRWTIAPGDRYQGEPDLAGYLEMVYVVRGELSLQLEDGERRLKAGESCAFPSDRSYAFVNAGKGSLSFILNVVA